jgi:hypothetical protein
MALNLKQLGIIPISNTISLNFFGIGMRGREAAPEMRSISRGKAKQRFCLTDKSKLQGSNFD